VIARLLLILLAGCYSFPTMGRARIVERRHLELWAAPSALVVATPGGDGQEAGASVRPLVDAGARYGLSDHFELDAHLSTFGIAAGSRIQLVRSADPEAGLDLLVAPAFAFTFMNKPALELPLVAGWNLRGRHQLVASARIVYQQHWGVDGVSGPVHFAYAGGSLGFVWQLWEHVALVPEIAILTELWAQPGFTSELPNALGMQGGIGVLWDH